MSESQENAETAQNKASGNPAEKDVNSVLEQKSLERPEISGTAIARMMGVATSSELRLLEGKLDLISGRMANLGVKVDKVISQFSSLPTGSDMERIDVQIGSLKALIRDLALLISGAEQSKTAKPETFAKTEETQIIDAAGSEAGAE